MKKGQRTFMQHDIPEDYFCRLIIRTARCLQEKRPISSTVVGTVMVAQGKRLLKQRWE